MSSLFADRDLEFLQITNNHSSEIISVWTGTITQVFIVNLYAQHVPSIIAQFHWFIYDFLTVVTEDYETAKELMASEIWSARFPSHPMYKEFTFKKNLGNFKCYTLTSL